MIDFNWKKVDFYLIDEYGEKGTKQYIGGKDLNIVPDVKSGKKLLLLPDSSLCILNEIVKYKFVKKCFYIFYHCFSYI